MDRQGQIDAIEKTFTEAKEPITKHHSKPNVVAVETLSVFPDFKVCPSIFYFNFVVLFQPSYYVIRLEISI